MIIKNANIFKENCKFEKGTIMTDGELISNSSNDDITIDAEGLYAIPGLTDVHTHGCKGHDFCEGTNESLDIITKYMAQNGITSFTPTSMTLPKDRLEQIYKNFAQYDNKKGSICLGINMEGPFVSVAKKGAQNADYIQEPNVDTFEFLNKVSGNKIKQVALAPEEKNAMDFIKKVHDKTVISIAHTTADYDTVTEALNLGASNITHLFNAMPAFTHRAPGVIGAAFDNKSCFVELICDGIHIHPCVIRAAFQLFTDDRVVLISDSMMATGMEDGNYELGGQPVRVEGNRAFLSNGTIAGSATNLMDCLRQAVSFGIPLESAIKAAAVNSAKLIKEYDKVGSITTGKLANIVLLDKDLNIKKVILKGKVF